MEHDAGWEKRFERDLDDDFLMSLEDRGLI